MRIWLFLLLSLSLGSTTFGQGRPAGDRSPGDRNPVDREPPCGIECYRTARASASDCVRNGGDRAECVEEYNTLVALCLEEAGCEAPERPDRDPGDRDPPVRDPGDRVPPDRDPSDRGDREPRCGAECYESARSAAEECLQNGGSREQCAEDYREAIGPCHEAARCEPGDGRDRDRGDREPPCGLPCFQSARAEIAACRDNGGTREECGTAYREGLEACLVEAGCDDADDRVVAALLASPLFLRGDGNGDGRVNLSDAVAILGGLFLGQDAPGCMDAADANDDGAVDLADPAAILNSLFRGVGPLPAPSAERGHDPTPDDLDCFVSRA